MVEIYWFGNNQSLKASKGGHEFLKCDVASFRRCVPSLPVRFSYTLESGVQLAA